MIQTVFNAIIIAVSPILQGWLQVLTIALTIAAALAGAVLYIGKRIDDLGKRIDGLDKRIDGLDKRIDDLRADMNTRFADLKDWIRSEVRRIEDRLERLEHPLVR